MSHHFKHISRDWTPRDSGRETYFLQMSGTEPESVLPAGAFSGSSPVCIRWGLQGTSGPCYKGTKNPKLNFL